MKDSLERLLSQAGDLSWAIHGHRLDFFLPGMFINYGRRGRFPAVSITGRNCWRQCSHCAGKILHFMLPATTPQALLELGYNLWKQGQIGMLISGGSDKFGRLPWTEGMLSAISELKDSTGLILTAHVGYINIKTAKALKLAGISQALVDVVGTDETARMILHLKNGQAAQAETLAACTEVGLEIVPHIIVGLHDRELHGEERALELLMQLPSSPQRIIFVVFMPIKGTDLVKVLPPSPIKVACLLARARLLLPQARQHLGCARPRGRYRRELDSLAVAAGINALALYSDEALIKAKQLGLKVVCQDTCCSLPILPTKPN